MTRTLTPELLDSLPPDHPDARASRRDLRVINRLMGNHRWFARTLPPLLRPGERALELGAGTGELLARLAARGAVADGLDFRARPPALSTAHAWHSCDLRNFTGYGAYAAVIGNLLLHHLTGAELAALGEKLRHSARLVLASEPKRSRPAQLLFAVAARCFGANRVTRHDGHVSIAAGFLADELPAALGLAPPQWDVRGATTVFGAYRLVATRRP
ncbi:MAG: hypothetical protein RLZZ15_1148 [Verrucomicrobiota bacterium]|jgi:2-polyprenyl-3-methyl-5-hydroxy-6-metoxy-1,4-benzoquinol methylase